MNTSPRDIRDLAEQTQVRQSTERRLFALETGQVAYVVTKNFTFKDSDAIDSLQVDATSGAITITLSTPNGSRRRRVIKTDASGNAVTVSAGGTILINGATTFALAAQYKYVWVEPTGTKWLIIGSN